MKCRAVCPLCNAHISRIGVLGSKTKCRACGAILRQNVKWDWIGSGVITFFIVSSFHLATIKYISPLTASAMVVIVILLAFLLWPYVSKYEIDPKHDKSKEKN